MRDARNDSTLTSAPGLRFAEGDRIELRTPDGRTRHALVVKVESHVMTIRWRDAWYERLADWLQDRGASLRRVWHHLLAWIKS